MKIVHKFCCDIDPLDRGIEMDLLQRAQEQRQHLLAEIDALEWFLRVADYLLSEGEVCTASEQDEFAIQFRPIMKVGRADFQRTMSQAFRHSRRIAARPY